MMGRTMRKDVMLDAAALIERRLVQTSSCVGIPDDRLNDYQRGIMVALRACQDLLREEARD